MIDIAVILSGVVGHWPDFFIILVLLIANAMVGFWEEREASNAIDALKAQLDSQPFDPVHKRTEATVKSKDGKTFKATRGAPQVIMALAGTAGQAKAGIVKAVNAFAARGLRALGVARAEGHGQTGFVWGYALLWFLVNDRIKLLAFRIFDPVKAGTKP